MNEIEIKVFEKAIPASYSIFKTNGCVILNLSSLLNRFGSPETDVEVSVPQVSLSVGRNSILILFSIWNVYGCGSVEANDHGDKHPSSSSMVQFLRHLDKLDGKEEDCEIDFERLGKLMEQVGILSSSPLTFRLFHSHYFR